MDRFDPNLPIYMACCNFYHSRTASKAVGFVEVVVLAAFTAHVASAYHKFHPVSSAMLAISIIFAVGFFLSVAIMARGICVENHRLLWFHFYVQVASLVVFVGLASLCAIFIKKENHRINETFAVTMAFSLGIVLMEVWFITINFACYRYFKDKRSGRSGRVL